MGFFDRLIGKPSRPSASPPNSAATPAPAPVPEPSADESTSPAGKLLPQLAAARQKLEQRDLDGAKAIYEEILAVAGDRPDVLVTISGDLGSCGYLEPIVELIAPRYDAERHGPATGLNLLQAYLALRNPEAAQHVVDILFALKRPDLEERLWGFSNAIAELIEARKRGAPPASAREVRLVTISKPIWSYGLEPLPGILPPKDGPLRRIALAQLALLGPADLEARMARPEDALGRFCRGLPLWLHETLYFSAQYEPVAAVGLMGPAHYALFPTEWSPENIRQLIATGGKFDYVLTGALREANGDSELVLRLWEIKSFRERKTFEARWTPATADTALGQLHTHLRTFFEWKPAPGLTYAAPANPSTWIDTLGTSLSYFLVDKTVLPKEQLAPLPALSSPNSDEAASLAYLTLLDRARRLGAAAPDSNAALAVTPLVTEAAALLSPKAST